MALPLVEDARHLGLDIGQDVTKLGPDVHAGRVPDLLEEPCHDAVVRSGFRGIEIMIRECSKFGSMRR